MVARSRGHDNYRSPEVAEALCDVAHWLGYATAVEYNDACMDDPDRIRQQLRDAT